MTSGDRTVFQLPAIASSIVQCHLDEVLD